MFAFGDERLPPRFWAKIEVIDGHWIWMGARSGAHGKPRDMQYGYFNVGGKILRAGRVAYTALVGPIPDGLELDHLCRIRPCVNPACLEPVTTRENCLRGESPASHQARQTHCKYGHEFTPGNTYNYRGKRYCKACNRRKAREHYARSKQQGPR